MFFFSSGKFVHPVIKPPTVGNKAAAQAAVEVTLIKSLLFNGVLFVAVKIRKKLEDMVLWIVLEGIKIVGPILFFLLKPLCLKN